jgi:carbon monoxide dehydrogenase subunit G
VDPVRLVSILPDVEESKIVDGDHFFVKSKVGMGYIKGSMSTNFEVTEKRQNEFAKIMGKGRGIQSTLDLVMAITLADTQGGTTASWRVDARIGGLLASIGSRLIGSAAEKYVNQITANLKREVSR